MPESLAEKVLAQLLEAHPDLTITKTVGGGCESCGVSTTTHCILCDAEEWMYASPNIPHRDGCSVPLIQAAQHEAGLHEEPV